MMKKLSILLAVVVIGCKSQSILRSEPNAAVLSAGLAEEIETPQAKESHAVVAGRVEASSKVSRNPTGIFDPDKLLTEIIGSSVEGAERLAQFHGKTFRVVSRNGHSLTVTAELDANRVSAEVIDDKVVAASWF